MKRHLASVLIISMIVSASLAAAFDSPTVTVGIRNGTDYRFYADTPIPLEITGKSAPEFIARAIWPWGLLVKFEHCGTTSGNSTVKLTDKTTIWDTEFKKDWNLDLEGSTTLNRAEFIYPVAWPVSPLLTLESWKHSARFHGYQGSGAQGGGNQDKEASRSFSRILPGIGISAAQDIRGGMAHGRLIAFQRGYSFDAGYTIPTWQGVLGTIGYRMREMTVGDLGKLKISGAYVELSIAF
jgi:hypothetical protein